MIFFFSYQSNLLILKLPNQSHVSTRLPTATRCACAASLPLITPSLLMSLTRISNSVISLLLTATRCICAASLPLTAPSPFKSPFTATTIEQLSSNVASSVKVCFALVEGSVVSLTYSPAAFFTITTQATSLVLSTVKTFSSPSFQPPAGLVIVIRGATVSSVPALKVVVVVPSCAKLF